MLGEALRDRSLRDLLIDALFERDADERRQAAADLDWLDAAF